MISPHSSSSPYALQLFNVFQTFGRFQEKEVKRSKPEEVM